MVNELNATILYTFFFLATLGDLQDHICLTWDGTQPHE